MKRVTKSLPKSSQHTNRSITALTVLLAVFSVSSKPVTVHGQDLTWNNVTGNNAWFEHPLNWTPNAIPGPGSFLSFESSSSYQVLWGPNTQVLSPTVHAMWMDNGGNVTFVNVDTSQQYQLEVLGGIGPTGNYTPLYIQGATLNLSGLHLLCRGNVTIRGYDEDGVLNVNGSHPVGSRFTVGGSGVLSLDGEMNITGSNAVVTSAVGYIGSTSTSQATVSGTGARWENSGNLRLGGWANGTSGTLNVLAGGVVTSTDTILGEDVGPFFSSRGVATVSGSGSWLNSTSEVVVGDEGIGTLSVADGGLVTSTLGVIGYQGTASGTATVTGDGSRWLMSDALIVGGDGNAALDILDGGRVSVGSEGTTSIGLRGLVRISGANSRFDFGRTTFSEFQRIVGTGGSLSGIVGNSDYVAASEFTTSISSSVNLDEVRIENSGTLYGNATIRFGLNNMTTGQVDVVAGERMRFAGSGNTNAGEINNFGGQVRFNQDVYNDYSGMVTGRGQFIADGGWYNNGVMAFSAGVTDVLGDFQNGEGAKVVTTGNGITTFHDDVVNEVAGEIRTAAGSSTVFLGALSGSGNFTGDGTIFMEGDLRPGNSPGSMSFGGDLVMSDTASLLIELGGTGSGEFDQLFVNGDLFVNDSDLTVALWNGFTLSDGMEFLVGDVNGALFGQFSGLGEGSLVGNFGGQDLFITYNGFNGNSGIGLFTSAVPEPSGLAIVSLVMGSLAGVCRRKRDS